MRLFKVFQDILNKKCLFVWTDMAITTGNVFLKTVFICFATQSETSDLQLNFYSVTAIIKNNKITMQRMGFKSRKRITIYLRSIYNFTSIWQWIRKTRCVLCEIFGKCVEKASDYPLPNRHDVMVANCWQIYLSVICNHWHNVPFSHFIKSK